MELILFLIKTAVYYWQTDRLDMMIDVFEAPLTTMLLLCAIWMFFSNRKKKGWGAAFYIIFTLITLVMFADAAYSSYFGKYISVNQIYQLGSLSSISGDGNVVGASVNPLCILTLIDYPFVICLFHRKRKKEKITRLFLHIIRIGIYLIAAGLFVYFGFNPMNERYVQKVNHVEFFTYHTNDILVNVVGKLERNNIDEKEVQKEMKKVVPKSEGSQYRGVAQGRNLILIQVESLNDFPIGKMYNEEEITPNINRLLGKDTFYFDRFYSTTGVGNTSDAEFATLNGLYPNDERECYRKYVDNTFEGLPWMLREEGYDTMAFHGYVKTFWNREEAYKNQGIARFYSEEDFDVNQVSGFGLTDKEMFRQAVDILKTKKQPFFSFMITLTNHIPYDMPSELATLKLKPEDEGTTFGRYLQTVRYTDEAIAELITLLKENNLYDNSMIVFYGDHQGLNMETIPVREKMTGYLGKTYNYDEMLKIPLVIHIPGCGVNETITTVGGQVDIMPTIANLMGLTLKQPYVFGHDLLNTEDGFIAQISYIGKGSFIEGNQNNFIFAIGKDGTIENGRMFHIPDGTLMNLNKELCSKESKRAESLIDICQNVLDHNLIANYITH